MGQKASRWPRGSPGGGPLSRYQSSGLFGSSLQESAGGKAAGERETDPAGSQSMLVPNTGCLEILRSGQCWGRAVRRGENSRTHLLPHLEEGEITLNPFSQLCSADALGNFP